MVNKYFIFHRIPENYCVYLMGFYEVFYIFCKIFVDFKTFI